MAGMEEEFEEERGWTRSATWEDDTGNQVFVLSINSLFKNENEHTVLHLHAQQRLKV